MLDLCPAPRRAFFCVSFLGRHPKPALLFLIAEKDPAGGLCKKASTPSFYSWSCTPNLPFFFSSQKKKAKRLAPRAAVRRTNLFLSGHFTTFFQGLHPLPALLFFIAKKVSKKASPLGTYKTYFEPGVLQPFFRGCTPNPPYFFHCKKVSKKLAPREAIKFIFIRAFYNSLRSDK